MRILTNLVLILSIHLSPTAAAQTATAILRGTATYENGAVVSAVNITCSRIGRLVLLVALLLATGWASHGVFAQDVTASIRVL
jgi:hypothetical protein